MVDFQNNSLYFKRGQERKRRKLAVKEDREVITRAFSSCGIPLYIVNSFRYLGWVILVAD